ncbi:MULTISPECIES: hypothetical protein [unclassified Cryobacterium]|uniref:hypothetical protein n=1 Tax=unclassified Cryobacterium TaxID=2649013 RepID=UPI00106B187B|nr:MULTISPECIES: hypothetical protein [unclassified Cryobacterium]TFD05565.1 hypothetical protein E3T29_12975 [Cryobacterium sp. TMT1-66-1]TFD08751.1 hypothetical protein E3T35_15170 [Cryobacterium sp. TMT1-2-2]
MPSYRVTMSIESLHPGTAPASVVPRAAAAAAEFTTVEASDLTIVAGAARVIVRFTADDAASALQIGAHVVADLRVVAELRAFMVTERVKGTWVPVR